MILHESLFYNCPSIIEIANKKAHWRDVEIVTDSRKTNTATAFIALRGERHDAFSFITDQLCRNSGAIIFELNDDRQSIFHEWKNKFPETMFIGVTNTTTYFQELAGVNLDYWKDKYQGRVFAITGSNGKTTNKDMLQHVLESLFPDEVHATWKNFNNHIGLPLTLVSLQSKHRYLVLEMGTNHPGEIARLCEIAKPSCGFITNIGDSHLEFFQSRENVLKEKSELYHSCIKYHQDGDFFIINGDDPLLKTLVRTDYTIECAEDSRADCIIELNFMQVKIKFKEAVWTITNPNLIGIHNYRNCAMVYCLLTSCFPDSEQEILQALQTYQPKNNRSELITRNNQTIFLDAYNANPSSMRASILGFKEYLQFHSADSALFVIGDMNELGDLAEISHRELGQWVDEILPTNWDVIFVGRYHQYFDTAKRHCVKYPTLESLLVLWDQKYANYPYLFIKASRSLQLESLVGIK